MGLELGLLYGNGSFFDGHDEMASNLGNDSQAYYVAGHIGKALHTHRVTSPTMA